MMYERSDGLFVKHINFKNESIALDNRSDSEEKSSIYGISPQGHYLFPGHPLPSARITLKMSLRNMPYSYP